MISSAVVVVLTLAATAGWAVHDHSTGRAAAGPSASAPTTPAKTSPEHHPQPPRPPAPKPPRDTRLPRGVRTPGGMWWGVDSSGSISAAALANVKGWYQGAHPQFWGRYVNGPYGVTRPELAFARHHGIYVALLVTDRNCSQCDGQDICGNDETAVQARQDALAAIRSARRVGAPRGALLIKDTEQISSCRDEPSPSYLLTWFGTVRRSGYRTGFYGNVHGQDYDFPRDYCAARRHSARFAADVVLDMDENEPRLGAPRGTTGPRNAPPFRPQFPDCSPRTTTVIWQYGESIDPANDTDIDQARPGTAGLLAPDGGVTV